MTQYDIFPSYEETKDAWNISSNHDDIINFADDHISYDEESEENYIYDLDDVANVIERNIVELTKQIKPNTDDEQAKIIEHMNKLINLYEKIRNL